MYNDDGFGDGDFNDSVVSVELLTACQHNVMRLYQSDPQWGTKQYDNGGTMGEFGCALTALTMGLNAAGLQITPLQLNQYMTNNKLFSPSGAITWEGPVSGVGSAQHLKFKRDPAASSVVDLARQLCATGAKPIVLGVKGTDPNRFPGHFVLATGVEDGRIVIADPGHADRTFLDDINYKNQFLFKGFVTDPLGDLSALEIAVDDADLLVVDPASRRTGILFSTGEKVVEIPQSGYSVDALDNDVSGVAATSTSSDVGIFQPAEGTYQIQVRALPAGPQELSIHPISSDGRPQPVRRIPLSLGVGQIATFSVTFAKSGKVDFVTIYSSTISGFGSQLREVIRTEARWSEFWIQLNSNLDPPPPEPEVDFTREVVVAVAMGAQPSTGFTTRVGSIRVVGTSLSIAFTEVSPGANCTVQHVITRPVDVVRVSAADVPQSAFSLSQQTTICP